VCEVADLNKISLRGLVDKSTAESIKQGSAVNVEFREIPKEIFTGKIVSVASQPVEQKDGEALYELRIELDNPDSNVLPEMEAVAIVVSD
jgi:multidrug efflux pump subunit AcrA (membrane-fusion protein)